MGRGSMVGEVDFVARLGLQLGAAGCESSFSRQYVAGP
jgi:hypothetical protein